MAAIANGLWKEAAFTLRNAAVEYGENDPWSIEVLKLANEFESME